MEERTALNTVKSKTDTHTHVPVLNSVSKLKVKSKDKVSPKTVHEGTEGKQSYSSTLSLTYGARRE
jgi:hypothetical protein